MSPHSPWADVSQQAGNTLPHVKSPESHDFGDRYSVSHQWPNVTVNPTGQAARGTIDIPFGLRLEQPKIRRLFVSA